MKGTSKKTRTTWMQAICQNDEAETIRLLTKFKWDGRSVLHVHSPLRQLCWDGRLNVLGLSPFLEAVRFSSHAVVRATVKRFSRLDCNILIHGPGKCVRPLDLARQKLTRK